jgi:O-antigen/teichoic acid export membrane protein
VGIGAHVLLSGVACAVAGALHLLAFTHNKYFFYTAIILLLHGALQMTLSRMAALGQFDQQHQYRLAVAVVAYPGAIALYFAGVPDGLFITLLLGNILPLAWFLVKNQEIVQSFRQYRWEQAQNTLKEYQSTGFYLTAGNLLASLADQGMVLLIAHFYSPVEAAACFLAMRICGAPLSLVQGAISPYNYRIFQDLAHRDAFHSGIITRHWKKWSIIGLCLFVPIMIAGPEVFFLFLGKDWNFAGQIARVIAILAFSKFLSTPTSMGFFVTGNTRFFFFSTLITAISLPICYGLVRLGWPLLHVLMTFALLQSIAIWGCNIWMLRIIDQNFHAKSPSSLR